MKKRDSEGFDCSVIVEAYDILSAGVLSAIWSQTVSLYLQAGDLSPPTPANMNTFPPCSLSVTERQNFSLGLRIGRVKFLRPDGSGISDQVWTISDKSIVNNPPTCIAHAEQAFTAIN